jgi:hypothetical protein
VMELTPDERKRKARRAALWLGLLALAFYVGFIAMSLMKAR